LSAPGKHRFCPEQGPGQLLGDPNTVPVGPPDVFIPPVVKNSPLPMTSTSPLEL
jgi:hypothetical protein